MSGSDDLRRVVAKYVPPAEGQPAPEPPNAQDKAVTEGPHRHRIAALLDELTAIAVIDWQYRHLIPRRNAIFVELRKLFVTTGRMKRAYAIAELDAQGRPGASKLLITHVGIKGILDKAGVPIQTRTKTTEDDE